MKQHAAAADRNKDPILAALAQVLGPMARVLEIGSGTGQHAAHFTRRMPGWTWQPSDARAEARASIEAYCAESSCAGFLPPIALNVESPSWPAGPFDAVFAANVIHIAPWTVCVALMEGAARVLRPGGKLVFYGPFAFSGKMSPESNRAFDARLRADDPRWGIRDVDDLVALATPLGFGHPTVHAMPANNHLLVFDKAD